MDTLKAKVAQTVRTHLQNINWWIALDLPSEVDQPETQVISDLQTRIRVHTPRGPRYFIVTVKEQM